MTSTSPNGDTPTERFEAQKRAAGIAKTNNMWWVYVLELKPGEDGLPRFYIGHTNRLERRLHDHMTGRSCEFVRLFGVLTVLECLKSSEEGALGLEVAKTTEYKLKYGWDNVRGGRDNNPGSSLAVLPRYWQAPADGLESRRPRSRSPIPDPDE